MLMALDLPLPGAVVAHAHWTMGNLKMSKSRGNVANPYEAIKTYSKDGIRYFLMQRGRLDVDSGKCFRARLDFINADVTKCRLFGIRNIS